MANSPGSPKGGTCTTCLAYMFPPLGAYANVQPDPAPPVVAFGINHHDAARYRRILAAEHPPKHVLGSLARRHASTEILYGLLARQGPTAS